MAGELLSHSLTRRGVLLGATAIVATALAAACGQEPTSNASPTPAPTRIVIVPTPPPPSTPSPPQPTPTATTIPVPTVGTTLATRTGSPTTPLIVFTGGATSSGYGVLSYENFAAQTMALLAPSTYDAVNLSIAREVSIDDLNTAASSAIDPLYAASRSKNIVVLYAGSNDLAAGTSVAATSARLATFCQARRSGGFKVVISTILPRSSNLRVSPNDFETARQGYNANLRQNVTRIADALADVAGDPTIGVAGASANQEYYDFIGVTLTAKGHRIVAGIMKAAIQTL